MKAPFGIGDVVVCVKTNPTHSAKYFVVGRLYTVRKSWGAFEELDDGGRCQEPTVSIFGYPDTASGDNRYFGWSPDLFRLYDPPKPEVKVTEKQKEKTE